MRDIHCPKDIGLKNTFSGEDCEKEQYYDNCYHCWSTALVKEKAFCEEREQGQCIYKKAKTGHWIRMSDLSEQEDDRYKCSHCGNVIHHKNKMDLYTFNSWCGRCGSNNRK